MSPPSPGFMPGPGMAVYHASKAYVVSLTEALHEELKADGVKVCALCPGPVPTEFNERASVPHGVSPRCAVALGRTGRARRLRRLHGRPPHRGAGRSEPDRHPFAAPFAARADPGVPRLALDRKPVAAVDGTAYIRHPRRTRPPTAGQKTMAEPNADIKKLTFETAIAELESIVKRLEEGKVPLEESVAIYERGEVLKKRCEELLQAGRGPGREDHPGRLRQALRHHAARRRLDRRCRAAGPRIARHRPTGVSLGYPAADASRAH